MPVFLSDTRIHTLYSTPLRKRNAQFVLISDSCNKDLAAPYDPGVEEHSFLVGDDMIKSPLSS